MTEEVEAYLKTWLHSFAGSPIEPPAQLVEAMEYSLLAGGKRLRPILCLVFAENSGLPRPNVFPFAAGIECIHTYSLIHDDLPAMDNDDLRRGKPTSHKKFGEAMAILAGDALLTGAFELMTACTGFSAGIPGELVLRAMSEMAVAAGRAGMVGGQVLDMAYTGQQNSQKKLTAQELTLMQTMKTGELIRASCLCGAILAGAEQESLCRAITYGENLGAAFQITDDLLDVLGDPEIMGKPSKSDLALGKLTWPALIGLEESGKLAEEKVAAAKRALQEDPGPWVPFLKALADYVLERQY